MTPVHTTAGSLAARLWRGRSHPLKEFIILRPLYLRRRMLTDNCAPACHLGGFLHRSHMFINNILGVILFLWFWRHRMQLTSTVAARQTSDLIILFVFRQQDRNRDALRSVGHAHDDSAYVYLHTVYTAWTTKGGKLTSKHNNGATHLPECTATGCCFMRGDGNATGRHHKLAGKKKNGPPYPLSPTRCWRYHFSYLDFGGDCGLGRCKRPAEARCLPPFQSLRLGSRKLNPLLDSHTQKYTSIEITHDPQPDWGAGVQGGHRSVLDGDLWRLKTKGVLWLVEAKSHWQII